MLVTTARHTLMTGTVEPVRLALRHATKVRAAAMQFWTALGLDASATRKRLPLELVHTVHTAVCQSPPLLWQSRATSTVSCTAG